MEKDNCLVQVEGEDGKVFNMLILKEFDYKDKKYAVLTEVDNCHCGCGDDCNCDDDCDCGCKEGKECTCNHECHCDDNCDCGHEKEDCKCDGCDCEEEDVLCILEISKDENGNEIFKSIDDEKLFNEIVEEADKVLYED